MNDTPKISDSAGTRCDAVHPMFGQCENTIEDHWVTHVVGKTMVIGTQRWPTMVHWSNPHTHPLDRVSGGDA